MLAEVDIEIRYRPGRKNSNVDALSRSRLDCADDSSEGQVATASSIPESPPSTEMTVLQHEDPDLQMILSYLEKKELPSDEKKARRLVLESDCYTMLDEVFYFVDNSRENRLRVAAPSAILGHYSRKTTHKLGTLQLKASKRS